MKSHLLAFALFASTSGLASQYGSFECVGFTTSDATIIINGTISPTYTLVPRLYVSIDGSSVSRFSSGGIYLSNRVVNIESHSDTQGDLILRYFGHEDEKNTIRFSKRFSGELIEDIDTKEVDCVITPPRN